MKEMSDINKILEGRCRGKGIDYVGFKKANESHSIGEAMEIYDPIVKRTVDVLSKGERMLFWDLRFDENVKEIREQHVLSPDLAAKAAVTLGIRVPQRILTNDLLALYKDGSITAFSVKSSRKELDPDTRSGKAVIRRMALEQLHWKMLGVGFRIVFTKEMDRRRAVNIESAMSCYDSTWVETPDQIYKWLIAHHIVQPDLSRPIAFAKVARENEKEIRELYRKHNPVRRWKEGNNASERISGQSGWKALPYS